ncbi:MAG: S-layer homology domain-containing protein, partial [Clostridia bacterium]|nr:S-layer homology domain-containing protein [Clostridia bacterium]
MKKIILTLLIFAFLFSPSFGDGAIDLDIDGDTVQVTVNGTPNKSISIVISDDYRKYYIDQGVTDSHGNITFSVTLDEGKNYNCSVNINGAVKTQAFSVNSIDPGEDPEEPNDSEEDIAKISIKGYNGYILSATQVEVKEGDTVESVTERVLDEEEIDYTNKGGYFSSIGGQAERDKGNRSGWLFKLNGKYSNEGMDEVDVDDGDEIQWIYTTDYIKDREGDLNDKEDYFKESDLEYIINEALSNKTGSIELKFKNTNPNEAIINLSPKIHEEAFKNGIKKVSIKTELAVIDLTTEIFKDSINGKQIGIEVKKVEKLTSLPELNTLIPKKSIIVDINILVENKRISQFKEPLDIRIPYLGDAKYGDSITVFLLKDDGTIEPMGGIYDAKSKTVRFSTNHLSKYFAKPSVKQFDDLNGYPWAKNEVEIMAGKNYIRGREEKVFDPSKDITRAEFVTMINRMFKYKASENAKIGFEDVNKQSWYYEEVAAACENGLINGKSETIFDPEDKITRQEASKIIAEVLNKKSYESK